MTFYSMGVQKVETHLNVDRILKQLNIVKYLLKNKKNKQLLASLGPKISFLDIDKHIASEGEMIEESSLDYDYHLDGY